MTVEATADALLRVGLPERQHQHRPMVVRMGDPGGGYRWVCIDCPVTGGPPQPTAAAAWRDGNGRRW